MKLIKLWEKIGKQPLKVSNHLDVIVNSGRCRFFVTGINYDNGKFVGLQAEKICCDTCKNNTEGYELPETCKICSSPDHREDDYYMWESKQ